MHESFSTSIFMDFRLFFGLDAFRTWLVRWAPFIRNGIFISLFLIVLDRFYVLLMRWVHFKPYYWSAVSFLKKFPDWVDSSMV